MCAIVVLVALRGCQRSSQEDDAAIMRQWLTELVCITGGLSGNMLHEWQYVAIKEIVCKSGFWNVFFCHQSFSELVEGKFHRKHL